MCCVVAMQSPPLCLCNLSQVQISGAVSSLVYLVSGLCMWWSFFLVSNVEDQSDPEVGGRVEGTGLSGSWCLFCSSGGKWTFPQVLPVGVCFSMTPLCQPQLCSGCLTVFWFSSMPWSLTPEIPPFFPVVEAYWRCTRLAVELTV